MYECKKLLQNFSRAFTNEMVINKYGNDETQHGWFRITERLHFLCLPFAYYCEKFLIKLSLLYIVQLFLPPFLKRAQKAESWKCKKFTNYDQKFKQCNCNNKLELNVERPPCAWLIFIPPRLELVFDLWAPPFSNSTVLRLTQPNMELWFLQHAWPLIFITSHSHFEHHRTRTEN